jgi:hypothetical protein
MGHLAPNQRLKLFNGLFNLGHVDTLEWFDKYVEITKVVNAVDKGSASASIIMFGIEKAMNEKLFIKMGFGNAHNELYYERLLYRDVATRLVSYNITPGVVPMLGYVRLDNVFQECDERQSRAQATARNKQRSSIMYRDICNAVHASRTDPSVAAEFSPDKLQYAHLLITEAASGSPVEKWIAQPHSLQEIKDVLFQIYYTLMCFNQIGFMHADLHGGNVFVDPNKDGTELVFILGENMMYRCKPAYITKIYDFDRSWKIPSPYPGFKEGIKNEIVFDEFSNIYGDKYMMDPYFDVARINYYMVKNAANPQVAALIQQWTNVEALRCLGPQEDCEWGWNTPTPTTCNTKVKQQISWCGSPCYNTKDEYLCVLKPEETKKLTMSPAEILQKAFLNNTSFPGTQANFGPIDTRGVSPFDVYSLPSLVDERKRILGGRFHDIDKTAKKVYNHNTRRTVRRSTRTTTTMKKARR